MPSPVSTLAISRSLKINFLTLLPYPCRPVCLSACIHHTDVVGNHAPADRPRGLEGEGGSRAEGGGAVCVHANMHRALTRTDNTQQHEEE